MHPVHTLLPYVPKSHSNIAFLLGVPPGLFLSGFPTKMCMRFSYLSCVLHAPPISSSGLDRPNTAWWSVTSFLPLKYKYSQRNRSCVLPLVWESRFHARKIMVLYIWIMKLFYREPEQNGRKSFTLNFCVDEIFICFRFPQILELLCIFKGFIMSNFDFAHILMARHNHIHSFLRVRTLFSVQKETLLITFRHLKTWARESIDGRSSIFFTALWIHVWRRVRITL
jgi:hypothetical protein